MRPRDGMHLGRFSINREHSFNANQVCGRDLHTKGLAAHDRRRRGVAEEPFGKRSPPLVNFLGNLQRALIDENCLRNRLGVQ